MELGKNGQIAHRIHMLFNEGRLEEILALAAEDCVVDFAPAGQAFKGRQGLLAFMKSFRTAFPDIALEWTRAEETRDGVVAEFRWRGTHRGPLETPAGTIAPTGRAVEGARVCEVITLRDGMLARIANYQDLGSWMRQIGVGG